MSTGTSATPTPADEESQRLLQVIKESHRNPGDDPLQQEAIQAAVNFIHAHHEEEHLFCNKLMYPASIHTLILFSFGEENNQALDWYKEKMAHCLDICPKCVTLLHRGRVKLMDTFITERGVSIESVELFSQIILTWESTRLLPRFRDIYDNYIEGKKAEPLTQIPTDLLKCLAECLSAPGMLRFNGELRECFDKALLSALKVEHKFVKNPTSLAPGYLFLAFEGNDVQKRWAHLMFQKLYNPDVFIMPHQLHLDVMEEYEIQLMALQKAEATSLDEAWSERFYRAVHPFFKLLDSTTIIDKVAHYAQSRPIDLEKDESDQLKTSIFVVLRDHIMSHPNTSLPYTLRVLELLLSRVGAKFWNEIGEFTFQNVFGEILRNRNLAGCLSRLPNTAVVAGEVNPAGRIADLTAWITPFLDSVNMSQRLKSVESISMNFITMVENQVEIPLGVKAVLFKTSCDLLSKSLHIPSRLYTSAITTDLLARSDTRVVVNSKYVRFFDYGTAAAIFYPEQQRENNARIVRAAIEVICKAMRFDILTFVQNSYEIHRGSTPSSLKFTNQVFQAVLKQNFAHHLELAYQLLCSMENVSTILPIGSTEHSNEVKVFIGYLSRFLTKFADIDAKNTKQILSNSKSLKGYWACVFSPEEAVYQASVDILYETFDAAGRLEGVQSLLENNIESCIQAINDNLTNLIFIQFFEPCPRAVRVLTDVIQALNNPVDGLFSSHETFSSATKEALVTFWNRCWTFLDFIYTNTVKWASMDKYKNTNLVEFTRDVLDLSHAVLGCFMTIKDVFGEKDPLFLFKQITNTFEHMLVWLRLSDPGLLASCVKLIASTVDLANDLDYTLDSKVVELLARYGSRSKKFNNKLTEPQCEEILGRARGFDADLVEKIYNEAEQLRKAKAAKDETPPPQPKSATPPAVTAPRLKQLKVDNFTSLSKGPPVAPSTKTVLPKSALEIAREKLRAKNAMAAAIAGKPKRAQSQDDDDSDDDDDDVHSLFNLSKPKEKKGITLLGDWNNKKKNTADQRKKEEEYSRLRLNIDMKPLYKTLLMWSFSREDDFPDSEHNQLKPVADTFPDAKSYVDTYLPLLLVECWQAICSARAREDFKPLNIGIASKSTVGDFFEVFSSMTKAEVADKGITESDLVVLAYAEKPSDRPTVKDVKRSKLTCFAKVHEIKHVRGDRVDLTLRVSRMASLNQWLNPQSPIMMMRVMQMTTIEREYSSLMGLRYYNLADQILKAQPNPPHKVSTSDVAKIRDIYQVNESQANAIGVSVGTDGFSLIQGPPGTGKTKTILGVIGYMLSSFRAANVIVPRGQVSTPATAVTRKVLVCAPSNAAVDELVLRLKDGVMNSKGQKYTPKLVRLGRSDAINTFVKDMTLEELVDAQLGKFGPVGNNLDGLFKELNKHRDELEEVKKMILKDNNSSDELYDKKRALTHKINNVKKQLDEERERQNSVYRNRDITRRNLQAKILGEAEIICSTLSGSAHDMVANLGIKFDSVIIDEACQCTELSAVIPLRYGCNRCIMVGDPNQLPPTVISGAAADANYDQSLFVRMAKNTKPLLLNVQYRMNSAISKFPSKMFYGGELKDGPNNDALTARPWHANDFFPPYRFYDIVEGLQSQNMKTFSFTNPMEVKIAIELITKLFRDYPNMDFTGKIGIITPYKEQNRLLQSQFIKQFGNNIKSEISFNTIDGFQGQEKEIIIMSCVRADPSGAGVGFLKDFRRMNVALTRPKCSLWILGHHDSLMRNRLWRDLITDAKERSCLMAAKTGFTKLAAPQSVTKIAEVPPQPTGPQATAAASETSQPIPSTTSATAPSQPLPQPVDNTPRPVTQYNGNNNNQGGQNRRFNNNYNQGRGNHPNNGGNNQGRGHQRNNRHNGGGKNNIPQGPRSTHGAPQPQGQPQSQPQSHGPTPQPTASGSIPPRPSSGGTLPPRPANSGTLAPKRPIPVKRKPPPTPQLFIEKKRRR